jgi:hypothetical protein
LTKSITKNTTNCIKNELKRTKPDITSKIKRSAINEVKYGVKPIKNDKMSFKGDFITKISRKVEKMAELRQKNIENNIKRKLLSDSTIRKENICNCSKINVKCAELSLIPKTSVFSTSITKAGIQKASIGERTPKNCLNRLRTAKLPYYAQTVTELNTIQKTIPKKIKNGKNVNFSEQLNELRSLALTITKDDKIGVKYDANAQTSFYNSETNDITLSLAPYPEFVSKTERLAKKVLDGDLLHEALHNTLTKPIWHSLNNFATRIQNKRGSVELAKHIINLIEDKRINYFGEIRFRLDLGKRLQLANLILKDTIETGLREKRHPIELKFGEAPLIMGVLCNKGLYEADCVEIYAKMSDKAKEATNKALEIMENTKYMRLKIDILKANEDIYNLIEPFCDKQNEFSLKMLIPSRRGGDFKGTLSNALKNALMAQITEEEKEAKKKAQELIEDLLKGSSAGEGTGEEIPTPEPDFAEYSRLVDRNKEEITKLLNKLKVHLKPRFKREIFQKRGKFMSPLTARAYVNSFRSEVKNVYLNNRVKFEKEQVCLGFLFDFSGSVDRTQALDITTILNEVFGNYVDDLGFAIAVFGENSQKIKGFFETFANTRARIGNIGVSASGTEISVNLASFLKMFNKANPERHKILIIASDFEFGDEDKALDLIKLYSKANIDMIFIGFCNCQKVRTFASGIKGIIKRTNIKQISELPDKFLEVYLSLQK